ncbi:hypothetical protein GA0115240_11641, partial [Streptomyces sp. DvalAA-14]
MGAPARRAIGRRLPRLGVGVVRCRVPAFAFGLDG